MRRDVLLDLLNTIEREQVMDVKIWSKKNLPSLEEHPVRQYLSRLNPHKSMDSDELQPRVLRHH